MCPDVPSIHPITHFFVLEHTISQLVIYCWLFSLTFATYFALEALSLSSCFLVSAKTLVFAMLFNLGRLGNGSKYKFSILCKAWQWVQIQIFYSPYSSGSNVCETTLLTFAVKLPWKYSVTTAIWFGLQ